MIRAPSQGVKEKVPLSAGSSLRPPHLCLESSIQYLKGVGPKRFAYFKRLGLKTLRDLVYHLPRRHEDRRTFLSISQLVPGQRATIRARVVGTSLFRAKSGTLILQVVVKDASGLPAARLPSGQGQAGVLVALWFNQPYMRRWFPSGTELILYGMVERIGRRLQMAVPEFEVVPAPSGTVTARSGQGRGERVWSLHMGRIVPIYPATSGLHQRELRTTVASALRAVLPLIQDPLPLSLCRRYQLLDLASALKQIHFPPKPEATQAAQQRLTFQELFYFQLALGLRRLKAKSQPGIAHAVHGDLTNRWKENLPFTLTPGQEKAIEEIAQDMASQSPMRRLIQGEVGSGKTVVAAYAMVVALQSGRQAVLMAPTEVLARQHALTLTQLLSSLDVCVGLLTSSTEESARNTLAKELREGQLSILVGTHALLEPGVSFPRLGLVVIDEQQKFGVDQRETLLRKGEHPDLLILTATPIPRTLALTLYGELEISTITEKPAGRQPVRTLWMDSTRRDQVFAFVKKELESGRQAYAVCPRITNEGKESSHRLVSATQIFQEYQQIFTGYRIGLLHGRMDPKERQRIFAAFRRGEIQLLVSTQIIEVGVDLANATVMVIEGAERFGLAQLHQLRGRVGRGLHEATCILLSDPKAPSSLERLQTVVETSDAFRIAEEDLRLRGPGELLGKRQSGLPDLKCLQWASQGPWLELTRKEAEILLGSDPNLKSPEGALLKEEVARTFPMLTQGCA